MERRRLHELDWLRVIAIVSMAIYHLLIRPFALIRPLFGVKLRREPRPSPAPSAMLRPVVQWATIKSESRSWR